MNHFPPSYGGRWLLRALGLLLIVGAANSLLVSKKVSISQNLIEGRPNAPSGTLTVQVIDEHGNPVSGATIQPVGLRTREEPGSAYGWMDLTGKSKVYSTDVTGHAILSYPLYTIDNLHTGQVTLLIEHPDFCSGDQDVAVDSPQPISLTKGTRLKFTAPFAPRRR